MTSSYDTDGASWLTVVRTVTDGTTVLGLQGEVDLHTVGRLRRALAACATDPVRLVVDLRWVTFMDSTGINALVALHRATLGTPGWIRLARPQRPVRRILQVSGLDTVIDCCPTLHQALHLEDGTTG
ncbi:STAS domain-containing protein [Streptomyces minutiscleroticus]|uniref:Anti-sigma factor antagonist n=1 Tax=Streptomyces minutiscleroticus TaxID=68238 RepID=A0A918NB76_9ACTN|nr:STAS domain-containing protein [Streptomyces minutiscleroticus]GGX59567.1 hypothetical protein GCM10010358_12560 [Streptomyces minutiscleroticus]